MKKNIIGAIGALLVALILIGCNSSQTTWITDLDEAKTLSLKSKKDLLVLFTGSDWNEPSQQLATEVFIDKFFSNAGKKFVLCNIDIMEEEGAMDPALLEKNYLVATRMGVQAMPTVMLFTHEGDQYAAATTSPEAQSSPDFINWLDSFSESRDSLVSLKKKINKSKGIERAKNIDAFINEINPSQRQEYSALIREILELDPNGEAGLRSEYRLQVAYLDAISLYETGELAVASQCFVSAVEEGFLDPAQAQEAWYMGAYLSDLSGEAEKSTVIEMLVKAIDADPENPGVSQIQSAIEQISLIVDED